MVSQEPRAGSDRPGDGCSGRWGVAYHASVAETEDHRKLTAAAIECDAEGQRALLADDRRAARAAFLAAAELYRRSWEAAPPGSYGRLVGMLKSAVLAGGGEAEADYALAALGDEQEGSPTACYALALSALINGDDSAAKRTAAGMGAGSDPFGRTAAAIAALADRDQGAYTASLEAIVRDFEGREQHLTGVPIADTAAMLERLAEPRGMAAQLASSLLPPARG
jgi:hypothetical protein